MKTDSLFHHRPFQAYWLSRIFTAAGFQILAVATAWQMYSITGSALDLGLVGLLEFAPRVLFLLQIGMVADRYDRRLITAATKGAQALAGLILCVLTIRQGMTREVLFALAFLLGTARAFEMPSMQALLPNIVPAALLPSAIAAAASAMQAATIVAPALGGFLFAIGPAQTYALSALMMLIACILMFVLPKPPPAEQLASKGLDHLLAGFRYIRDHKDILGAISLDLFAVLLGGATALLPIFASEILKTGPWGLGLLRSAPAVGAITVSVLLAYFPLQRQVGKKMFVAVFLFGVATIIFGLSSSIWLSLLALVLLGAADMVSMVVRGALVQLETPDHMRGRVSAVNGLFIGASNQLGEFESGLTAHWFGPQVAVVLGGVGTVLVAGLWIKWFPNLWHRDGMSRKDD
ncbi:MFS transporter [Chitinibacter fontanus]|uniref:MFS transporter n=1 Tax=Chitinibacter fontanus TaxID=1737446 RepID=A0A7D5ZN86_9NEIS|nr:MFS transporter [Chitinibacter fontanus]QLI83010.1 MFS transporter [Chitinibacter fontanus]